jgi:hypothetical protein
MIKERKLLRGLRYLSGMDAGESKIWFCEDRNHQYSGVAALKLASKLISPVKVHVKNGRC